MTGRKPVQLLITLVVLLGYAAFWAAILLEGNPIAEQGHPVDLAMRAALVTFPNNAFMLLAPPLVETAPLMGAMTLLCALFVGSILFVPSVSRVFAGWRGLIAYVALSAATTWLAWFVMLHYLAFPAHH